MAAPVERKMDIEPLIRSPEWRPLCIIMVHRTALPPRVLCFGTFIIFFFVQFAPPCDHSDVTLMGLNSIKIDARAACAFDGGVGVGGVSRPPSDGFGTGEMDRTISRRNSTVVCRM